MPLSNNFEGAEVEAILTELVQILRAPQDDDRGHIASRIRWSPLVCRMRNLLVLDGAQSALQAAVSHQARNRIAGNYAEFGVFRGRKLTDVYFIVSEQLELYRNLRINRFSDTVRNLSQMRFIGFDSFQGMPPATERVDEGLLQPGDLSASLEEVQKALSAAGVDLSRVDLVPGFFEDSLPAYKERIISSGIAIANVDCDFYSSARTVLQFLGDTLVEGGIIVFDDWFLFGGHPDRGEQKAFHEWLTANPQLRATEFMTTGWSKSFIIHRS